MRDEDFEWDDDKAASNLNRHKVDFETARIAFDDPQWLDFDDPDPDEDRYNRLCMLDATIYVVTYVDRDTRIRIISARRANKYEQDLYFDR